jgi:hypothetical protein
VKGHKSENYQKCKNHAKTDDNIRVKRQRDTSNALMTTSKTTEELMAEVNSFQMTFMATHKPLDHDTLIEFTDDEQVAYSLTIESYQLMIDNCA